MPIQSLCTSDCIDEVIEHYSKTVFRLALAHVKTRHDAEDVFQDVFLRYISRPRLFESEEHRKAWFIRVTINRSKSLWLSAWFRKTEPLENAKGIEPMENAKSIGTFEMEEETDLYEYLLTLPQKYRSVIHLFYYEDMSVKEIGHILKAKESTVRTWLTRARAMLKDRLEEKKTQTGVKPQSKGKQAGKAGCAGYAGYAEYAGKSKPVKQEDNQDRQDDKEAFLYGSKSL